MMSILVRAALVFLAASVVVFNLSVWLSPHLLEQGDLAANALQIERAREFRELLGPYSQHGFHHLGPISFYYYGAAQSVFAFLPAMLARHMLAQYLLNLACLAGILRLLRLSGLAIPLVAAGGFLIAGPFVWLGGGDVLMLASVWGPLIAALPVILFGLTATRLMQGDLGWLPVGILAGTLALHNQLSSAAVLGVVAITTSAVMIVRRDRLEWTPAGGRRQLVLSASLFLAFLAVIPGLLEQQTTLTGNLTLLFRFFSANGPDIHPWSEVVDKLGQAVTDPWVVLGAWTGIDFHAPIFVFLVLVALLFASAVQFRRSAHAWRLVIMIAWLMVTVTEISARTVPGNLHTYLYYYLHPLVGLLHLFLWKEIFDRWIAPGLSPGNQARATVAVVVAGSVFFLVWGATHRSEPPIPSGRYAEIVAYYGLEGIDQIHLFVDKAVENDQVWSALPTLALRFQRDGVKVTVPDSYVFLCGEDMRPEFDIHPRTLVITRRRPAGPDDRYLPGDGWGTFLLSPQDWDPAAFLADLPWGE
jgi:hypothetical protein